MERFIDYFVKRHLLTNLIVIAVFIGGVFSWHHIKKEEMPDVTFDHVRISATYPGATAQEVEHFVTKPIEEDVRGIDGVYRVTSTSSQGATTVTVEIEQDYPNKDEVVTEIRNAVLDVDLPDDVLDEPTVRVFKTSKKAIIDIAIIDKDYHLLDLKGRQKLQKYVHALENHLLSLPQVNSVDKTGYLQEEIHIKLDPQKLLEYDIPLSQVKKEVSSNHVRQPAGNIEIKNEPKVTLDAQLDDPEKLNNLIIQAGFEGKAIPLREIAQVQRGFKKEKEIIKVNGHEAVMFRVVKNGSFGILDSVNAVKRAVRQFKKKYLKGTSIDVLPLDDESIDLRNRLFIIATNGGIGFILILVSLFMFLNKRSGLWVGLGIPFTMAFTLIAANLIGYTINNITLAAVIIVMGMVVDDAIVVAENISRLRSQGMDARDAAVKGTAQVFFPILGSILTTCIAFVPLMFFGGRFGQLNKFMPVVIFLMLGSSLIESLIILPGHMYFELPKLNRKKPSVQKDSFPRAHWFEKVENRYGRFLCRVLPHKGKIFLVFLAFLVGSWFVIRYAMKYEMFPHEETREIVISGAADRSADRYDTVKITRKVEKAIIPFIGKEVVGFRTEIARSRRGGAVEENRFRMIVEIVPKEKRRKSADQLVKIWKKDIGEVPELKELVIQKSRWGNDSGSAIDVVVQENGDQLREKASNHLAELMKQQPNLINVDIERPIKVLEYKIHLKREKVKRLSIDASDIAEAFRSALEGNVLYELPREDEKIDVVLTVLDATKEDIEKVLDVPVQNKGGYLVPLRDLVDVEKTVTPNSISREDLKRTTEIYADLKKGSRETPLEIAKDLEQNVFPKVIANQPTTVLSFEGEIKDTRESGGDFKNAIILVCLLIFLVLAVLFNSLSRPIIIMAAIPFGVVGVVLAFLLHGKLVFGFFTVVGVLGLAGVVINDSIVMVSKLDKEFRGRKERISDEEIADIAKTRLRAVVLTTVTTVAGILPTAYGWAGYDAMLSEMMLALAWGLCFGTLITLVLIPCIYSFMEALRSRARAAFLGE